MFPQGELNLLAAEKARLQRISSAHRAVCVAAAAELARPVAQFDQWRAHWRRISPLVKIAGLAAGIAARRAWPRTVAGVGGWLRWGGAILGAVRQWRAAAAGAGGAE